MINNKYNKISDTEIGTCSIYEFIYSYRNSIESPFPDLTSQEANNALNMIKRIKNEIASGYYRDNILLSTIKIFYQFI